MRPEPSCPKSETTTARRSGTPRFLAYRGRTVPWHAGPLAEFAWRCLEARPVIVGPDDYYVDGVASRLARQDPDRAFGLLERCLADTRSARRWNPISSGLPENAFWKTLCGLGRTRTLVTVLEAAQHWYLDRISSTCQRMGCRGSGLPRRLADMSVNRAAPYSAADPAGQRRPSALSTRNSGTGCRLPAARGGNRSRRRRYPLAYRRPVSDLLGWGRPVFRQGGRGVGQRNHSGRRSSTRTLRTPTQTCRFPDCGSDRWRLLHRGWWVSSGGPLACQGRERVRRKHMSRNG